MSEKPKALVAGDAVLAWDFLHPTGEPDADSPYATDLKVGVYQQSGAAWHMANILRAALDGWDVQGMGGLSPADHSQLCHAYTVWAQFPITRDSKQKAYRVKSYLGTEWASRQLAPVSAHEDTRLFVLIEDGIGPDRGNNPWVMASRPRADAWLVWKIRSFDRARGLGQVIAGSAGLACRTVMVVSIDVLRAAGFSIPRDRTWEVVARETYGALREPWFSDMHCIIVSFSTNGALLVERDQGATKATLIYDPKELEGTWAADFEGRIVGTTTILVAEVAKSVAGSLSESKAPSSATLGTAIEEGIRRMRALHYLGYGVGPGCERSRGKVTDDEINPTSKVVAKALAEIDALANAHPRLKQKLVSIAVVDDPSWKILSRSDADGCARELFGEGQGRALARTPVASFGKLVTADPQEIEGYRAIARLLRDYARSPGDRPLSVAVLGPPGAGKSFGVAEIAASLSGVFAKAQTFNLSQFDSPTLLVGALHQVRTVGISGKIPLVFWDEFDTTLRGQRLGWLRYFLAPMNDGKFQEGPLVHAIGRAVFVFAGGIKRNMEELFPVKRRRGDRDAKLPDFVSRLRGYLHVLGPNPSAPSDDYFQLRRALVLRHQLDEQARHITVLDPAVLAAFLTIPEYKHGARSIEAIVRMSSLAGKTRFTWSCLPSAEQLHVHVHGQDFLSRARSGGMAT